MKFRYQTLKNAIVSSPEVRRSRNHPRLRTLDQDAPERHASWLELFFDLVFVFAVSQVARILAEHSDSAGFARYVVLFVPIWYSWVGYTFYADRFETDEALYRALMFSGMLAVIGFSLVLGNAFTIAGDPPFILCYILVRLVLVALYVRAAYYVPLARPYCYQFIIGLSISAVILVASLEVAPPYRYAVWAIAIMFEFAIPFINIKATRLIPVDRSHVPERFGLFTIIVLGEAVIATATGAGGVAWNSASVLMASAGFAMAACIWWINFDFVEDNAITSPALLPRFVFLYGHLFIVGSIVAIGVGVEHAIIESHEPHLHLPALILTAGGIAVYMAAITIIRMVTGVCNRVFERLVIVAVSLLAIYIGQFLPPIAVVFGLLALMIGGIWIETRYGAEHEDAAEPPRLLPCEHVGEAVVHQPRSADGCEECRKNNYKWVHLRLCLSCGHVGCCDTSVNKHATKHYLKTGHPIIASIEPGENWAWCYVDERFVPAPRVEKVPEPVVT